MRISGTGNAKLLVPLKTGDSKNEIIIPVAALRVGRYASSCKTRREQVEAGAGLEPAPMSLTTSGKGLQTRRITNSATQPKARTCKKARAFY